MGKIPRRRKWQPTPVFLPGESHGLRSLVGYSPRGRKQLDTTEQLHFLSLSSCCSRCPNKVKVKLLSHVRLFATPWTIAHQGPPSLEFSRYSSGLPFPSSRDLRDPGIEPGSPALQADALPSEPPGKHNKALPEFLLWSLDNFCWLGTAKNPGW